MMLSTISPSMPQSYGHSSAHDPPASIMASLPILPQRQPSAPVELPQRPKLQIDTHQIRTFGKGSSLRLDTLSAVSPTVRNTFSNAYDAPTPAVPTLGRRTKPQLSIDSSFAKTTHASPSSTTTTTPSSASTLHSALTSASSNGSATITIPYKQPHNLSSILTNSPARHLLLRKMAYTRPLFPAEKKVSFRAPLEEEIKTVRYTLAHSDLASSVSSGSTLSSIEAAPMPSDSESSLTASASSDVPASPNVLSPSDGSSSSTFASLENSPRPRRPQLGDKRDSSESDSDSCPETPVAGRRKRSRVWRWTLGPVNADKSTSSSTSDTTASELSEDSP
jgi:hypothetical protein